MKTQHEILMEDPEFRKLLSVEALAAEASEAIARLMAEQGVSKADLARRLDKSRAWVTQLLSGRANMTVRTLAEVVHALDAEVKLHTQSPGGMAAGKPHAGAWQSVTLTGDRYLLKMPVLSEGFFRLETGKMKLDNMDNSGDDDLMPVSEYAA